MTPSDLAFLPIVLPLAGAALALFAKAFGDRGGLLVQSGAAAALVLPAVALAAVMPSIAGGGALWGVVGGWAPVIGIAWRFDGLSAAAIGLALSVAVPAWIYSSASGPPSPAFAVAFFIQASAASAAVVTSDLFNLYVCLEVLGIASYSLIASQDKAKAHLAAFEYLAVGALTLLVFLVGLFGLYRLSGSLSYAEIGAALAAMPGGGGPEAGLYVALVAAAVLLRSAIVPFHSWLPAAHASAPHGISALLSGVLLKLPLFALFRFLASIPAGARVGAAIGVLGAAGALFGVVMALAQKDAKRLLAWHSVSQLGFISCAWGAAASAGTGTAAALTAGAVLHAMFHAQFKALLFLAVGTATDAAGTRDVYALRGASAALKARGERLPITLACFLVGALAIAGIPPLNGWASKEAISLALKGKWEYWALFAAGIGTVASFLKLGMIFTPAAHPAEAKGRLSGLGLKRASMVILAALCLAGGVFAGPLSDSLLSAMGTAVPASRHGFALSSFLSETMRIALGFALFLAVSSKRGKAIASQIRNLKSDQAMPFLLFAAGAAAVAFVSR